MSVVAAINRELYARNAELAVRNKTLSLLRKIDQVTLETLETDGMIAKIIRLLDKEFNYPFVAIALCDHARKRLEWNAFACLNTRMRLCEPGRKLSPVPFSRHRHPCIVALDKERRVVSRSLTSVLAGSVGAKEARAFEAEAGVKSVLILPLASGDVCAGVLVVGMNRAPNDLTVYEKDTFASLISLVTVAVQKAQTYTSLRIATEKLRAANKKLKELDALKSEFLSIATHQLRTPLAVMKGYVSMLEGGMLGKVSSDQKGALSTIGTSTEQLILLVNHLLDLTRIESGRLQVKIEPVDVDQIVSWIVDFVRPKATEKKLEIVWKPERSHLVKADPEKLKEVLMNITDNAIKYTEQGKVTLTVSESGPHVSVAVSDTGYGLTAQDQKRMFEKFATGSASKNVKTTSGIGLYVVKKLMEAMGGSIKAESRGSGKGSTFTATFPKA